MSEAIDGLFEYQNDLCELSSELNSKIVSLKKLFFDTYFLLPKVIKEGDSRDFFRYDLADKDNHFKIKMDRIIVKLIPLVRKEFYADHSQFYVDYMIEQFEFSEFFRKQEQFKNKPASFFLKEQGYSKNYYKREAKKYIIKHYQDPDFECSDEYWELQIKKNCLAEIHFSLEDEYEKKQEEKREVIFSDFSEYLSELLKGETK